MKKLKLLLAFCALLIGWSNAWAQKDVTSLYITNATLSSLTGWTNTNFNTPVQGNNTVGYATECYEGWSSVEKSEYSLTQTITLPAGHYTLVNYSFYREGQNADTDASTSRAYLKAGDNKVLVKTLGSITAPSYANNQKEGANCFDSKMYRNTVDFTIAEDNTAIEIGVYGTFNADITKCWIICGQFELIDKDQAATMANPFNVTGYITNPGFEYGDMSGWTLDPASSIGTQSNEQSWKVGKFFAEKWQASGNLTDRSMSQTLTDLPAGYYKLTANLGGSGTYVTMNDQTASWTEDKDYTVGAVLSEGDDLTITAGKSGGSTNWIHFDNFRLFYCGTLEQYKADITAAANVTLAKVIDVTAYNTLSSAITALDEASGTDAIVAAVNAVNSAVEDAEASNAQFETGTIPTNTMNGWAKSTPSGELAWNSWSTEGNTDGSGMTTPFVQDWVASGSTLGNGDLFYTWKNLTKDDKYVVTALVRILDEKNKTAPSGSTFFVNSATISIDDYSFPCTNGRYAKISAIGTVDANGDLKTGIRLSGSESNWMSIKDVTFSKVTTETAVSSIDLSDIGSEYAVGTTFDISDATDFLAPDGVQNISLGWTTSNADVISIGSGVLNFKGRGTATITATSANGTIANKSIKVGATDDEISAFTTARDAVASTHTLGFEDGEYAPYNNTTAAPVLAAALALDPNKAKGTELSDATTDLNNLTDGDWTANVGEVNAVYDGTFAAATNNGAPAGWTMSNSTLGGDYHSRAFVGDDRLSEFNGTKSAFFQRYDGTNSNRGSQYYYGNTTGYTMPLKAATTYRVTVDFTNWGTTDSKPLTLNVDGPNDFNASQTKNSTKDADKGTDSPDQFDIIFTTTVAGNYTIRFQVQGSDDNAHNVVVSNIELKKMPAQSKTISAAGWATYCSPYALDFSSSIANLEGAYIITGNEGSTLTLSDAITTTVPANTGLLLKGNGAVTIPVAASGSYDVSDNILVGVTTDTKFDQNTIYVLMNEGGNVGFYKNGNAEQFTVGANTAYLPVGSVSAARSAYFFRGDITGVDNVEAAAEAKAKEGKFIENGKLVIVKNGQKFNAAGAQVK